MTFTATLDQSARRYAAVGQIAPLFLTLSGDAGTYDLDVVIDRPDQTELRRYPVNGLALTATPVEYRLVDWDIPYAEAVGTHPVSVVVYAQGGRPGSVLATIQAGSVFVVSRSSVAEPVPPPVLSTLVGRAQFYAPLGDATALARVRFVVGPDRRPDNAPRNATIPTAAQLGNFASQGQTWTGAAGEALRARVTGTPGRALLTDEAIQWTAWKWGYDEDAVRAVCCQESSWYQAKGYGQGYGDLTTVAADCPPDAWVYTDGRLAMSYGITQVKWKYHAKGAWPLARDCTAFALDYWAGRVRTTMQGNNTWLGTQYTSDVQSATSSDLFWWSVGAWCSGAWRDAGALNYIGLVQNKLSARTWEGYT